MASKAQVRSLPFPPAPYDFIVHEIIITKINTLGKPFGHFLCKFYRIFSVVKECFGIVN